MTANGINGTPDLQEIHDFLIDLATRAGEIITGAKPLVNSVDSKKNTSDLVTEYDRAVESMISTELRSRYPHYEFMGEETYSPSKPLTNAPTFIVDPIDGTVNFVHSFPNSCISLGFAINRRPTVGVVYNPFTKLLYSAIAGRGAYRNRTEKLPLKGDAVEPLKGLGSALIAVEWGSDRHGQNWDTKIRTFEQLGKRREEGGAMVHSMRSMGSAALNLCAVAAGVIDLYWEGGCWAWDVCAGWVILTEAGGMIVDGNPGNWEGQLDGRQYLAVRAAPGGQGQKEIIQELWGHMQGTFDYTTK
ncbi:hypothetical protein AJ79_01125 [Helicocarpus griseus UAMH5409]|uniref:Inositol-1-monophosphatase n=1 Tax=Helicocarpus griseus UAMH5409 TaxID=1447875 RepID=A0A2B7Y8G0_9EURO|nr:hypothetical protein AJ79_01125 [Helicocarpus griseus UAMH5409]